MTDIDTQRELEKYQAELNQYVVQLQQLDNQRQQLIQAIAERRGIVIYLQGLDQNETLEENGGS